MRMSRTLAAVCVSSYAILASSGTSIAAPSPSLVVRYTFNTDSTSAIADASTNAITGLLVNADPATAFTLGKTGKGKALQLEAPERQYVAVPEDDALDVNSFTLSAWVRYTGAVTPETRGRWEVLEKAGAYWLNIRTDGHVRTGAFFGGCDDSRYWKYLDSTATVPPNTWTHVAATYNGVKLTIYIGGVRSGSLPVQGSTCVNNEPLAIGAKNAPSKGILEAFWDGQLDEVRIYSRALGASGIARLAR
ncbi:MAG: LamG domain-containing protein [Actinomycetes bacterium]